MEVLLRVEIEVIMFLALVEELLLHSVLPLLHVLPHFKLLSPQVIHEIHISLKKVFGHRL